MLRSTSAPALRIAIAPPHAGTTLVRRAQPRRGAWAGALAAWPLLAVAALAVEPDDFSPPFYPDKAQLLVLRDDQGCESPIRQPVDWSQRRRHILENMQLVMGRLPGPERRVAPEVRTVAEESLDLFVRREITFAVEPGDRASAYLLLPKGRTGKLPAVLCLHQTTAVGKEEPAGVAGLDNLHYASELAARGFVTLAIDYPNFGDYKVDVYAQGYASATMKGVWNHMRAVDLLVSLPEVDADRLGAIGHSLGGHNSLFVAAFDERIRCVVTCCGFCSFARYQQGDLTGWSHAGYMPRIAERYGRDAARMPFDFSEVLAAIAPRAVFVVAPEGDDNFDMQGVRDSIAAARPVYELLGEPTALAATHPKGGHDFPPAEREQAYRWFERWLGDSIRNR